MRKKTLLHMLMLSQKKNVQQKTNVNYITAKKI